MLLLRLSEVGVDGLGESSQSSRREGIVEATAPAGGALGSGGLGVGGGDSGRKGWLSSSHILSVSHN